MPRASQGVGAPNEGEAARGPAVTRAADVPSCCPTWHAHRHAQQASPAAVEPSSFAVWLATTSVAPEPERSRQKASVEAPNVASSSTLARTRRIMARRIAPSARAVNPADCDASSETTRPGRRHRMPRVELTGARDTRIIDPMMRRLLASLLLLVSLGASTDVLCDWSRVADATQQADAGDDGSSANGACACACLCRCQSSQQLAGAPLVLPSSALIVPADSPSPARMIARGDDAPLIRPPLG